MKITFRVDASEKIGTGHVMRCLTLADALKSRHEIEFIARETTGNLAGFIESRGYKVRLLKKNGTRNDEYCFHSSWLESHWKRDAEETLAAAKGSEVLVVDHYAIDEKWERALRPHIKK